MMFATSAFWPVADIVSCTAHVRYWHKAEMPFCAAMSAYDPKRTSRNLRRCQCLHLHEPGYRKPARLWVLTQVATMASPHARAT